MAALFPPEAPNQFGAMAGVGHEYALLRPRPSAGYRFSQRTFAGTRGNGRDAPKPAVHNVIRNLTRNPDRADYIAKVKLIEKEFGDFRLSELSDRRTRGIFMAWRAISSQGQADYTWMVLARILSWAMNRGLLTANPCEKGERLYRGSRADKVWTADDEALFIGRAPQHLHLPLLLPLWTGHPQGDLLRLPWSAYDCTHIRPRHSKTGAGVAIPVGGPLKSALDETPKRSTLILASSDNKPWTEDGFRSLWRKACATAGLVGLTFHDLGGTAVTRLALAGCTEAEIAAITGHSLRDVAAILDAHYLHRDPALAESAIRKLESRTKE